MSGSNEIESDGEAPPAEMPELSAEQNANIDNAMESFFGGTKDEAENTDPGNGYAARKAKAEEAEELAEDGLQANEEADEEKPVAAVEETPAKEEKTVGEQPAAEAEAPKGIDPNLRYFAETELGWTKERLERLEKADPELANEMIQNAADNATAMSRQLLTPPASQVAPGTQPAQQPPAQPASPTSKLDDLYANLAEFAEANGEELVEKFLRPLKSELIDPVRAILAENQARAEQMDGEEARTTFAGLVEKFGDLYGDPKKGTVTAEQAKVRAELGSTADQLRAGAKARGDTMTVKQAVNRAHLLTSAAYRQQEARQSIVGQVQRRSAAITARPTRSAASATPARSREAAAAALGKKAAELGVVGFDE